MGGVSRVDKVRGDRAIVRSLPGGIRPDAGAAYMEAVLILPLLFFIFLAACEFAQFIRVRQAALVLSREAALRASRRCGGLLSCKGGVWHSGETERRTRECLEAVRNEITAEAGNSLQGTQFRFSAVKLIPDDTPADPLDNTRVFVHYPNSGAIAATPLTVDAGVVKWKNLPMMSMSDFGVHQQLILVDMQYQYQPIIMAPLVVIGLGPILSRNNEYHEISIF